MAFGNGYGLQFQPGVPQNGEGNGTMTRGRVQEPIQILSTRLPKFFSAQSIAPQALLQGGGGMGMAGAHGNVVAQALAQLAGLPPGMVPASPGGYGGYGPERDAEILRRRGGMPPPLSSDLPTKPLPPLPSPSPIFMPPFNPPSPRVVPGGGRGPGLMPPFNPPSPRVVPGEPPVKEELPQPSPGGYGDWIRHERDLNRPSIQDLADMLFQSRGPFQREF